MSKLRYLPLAGVLFLAACHSGSTAQSQSQGQVASLESIGPTASASASPSGAARPQLRLDTSDAEATRLWTVYNDCLVAHGVKVLVTTPAGRRIDDSGEPKSAYVACQDKLPQQPPELDEDKNPNYAAQWSNDVKCLRAHGFKVHVTNPGEYEFDSGDTPIPDDKTEHTCLMEAFGAKS